MHAREVTESISVLIGEAKKDRISQKARQIAYLSVVKFQGDLAKAKEYAYSHIKSGHPDYNTYSGAHFLLAMTHDRQIGKSIPSMYDKDVDEFEDSIKGIGGLWGDQK